MRSKMLVIQGILLFIITLLFTPLTTAEEMFSTYGEPDYEGMPNMCVDVGDGWTVSNVIGIKIIKGSCAQILDSKTGKNLYRTTKDVPDTDFAFECIITSCDTFDRSIQCPLNTFVKKIEWDTQFNLRRGIKLTCYKPESLIADAILFSHPDESFADTSKVNCSGLNGITIKPNISLNAYTELDIENKADENKFNKKLACDPLSGVSGMNFTIEEKTKYIKRLVITCSRVPDIGALCEAEDEQRKISVHNAVLLKDSQYFQVKKIIGVGTTSSMSETNEIEFAFYRKFNHNIGYSLSVNFKENIGRSITTGYDWISAPKSTWAVERNVTLDIAVSPGCVTEIAEVVGKCSYMNIRPYYFERVDTCNGVSSKTTEIISDNNTNKTYKSRVLDLVKYK